MPLEYEIRQIGEITILDLKGRLTLGEEVAFGPGSGVVLGERIRQLAKKGQKKFVLNLAGVTYIDSSAIGQLVGALTTARNQGGNVKLLAPPKQILDLLKVVKLHTVFEIHADEADVIQSFAERASTSA